MPKPRQLSKSLGSIHLQLGNGHRPIDQINILTKTSE